MKISLPFPHSCLQTATLLSHSTCLSSPQSTQYMVAHRDSSLITADGLERKAEAPLWRIIHVLTEHIPTSSQALPSALETDPWISQMRQLPA